MPKLHTIHKKNLLQDTYNECPLAANTSSRQQPELFAPETGIVEKTHDFEEDGLKLHGKRR
jgi:hypothetical protein